MPRAREPAFALKRAGPLLALASVLACNTEPGFRSAPDFESPRIWTSQHFRYLSREHDASVCEPVLEQLERHFETLRRYLGFGWPDAQRIDYYKFADSKDLAAHGTCSAHNAACFYAEVGVQATAALHTHELVHAYLAPLGRRHTLLEEGLANALSCGHEVSARPEAPPSMRDAFDPQSWRSNTFQGFRKLYAASSWFVGWLLREYGPDPFMVLYEAADPELDASGLGESFEALYELPLAEAWRRAFEDERKDRGCVRVWECAQPDWFTEVTPASEVSCAGRLQIGRLELEEPSWVLTRSESFGLLLGSCEGTPEVPHQDWTELVALGQIGESFVLGLDRGAYFVSQSPDFPTGSIELYNFESGLGSPDTCSAIIPLSLDFRNNVTFALQAEVHSPEDAIVRFLDITPSGKGYQMSCSSDAAGSSLWCSDCDSCSEACDINVVVEDEPSSENIRTLKLAGPVTGPRWVRLSRTY